MLTQVEEKKGKAAAQKSMVATITLAIARKGLRNIGFPSGNRDEVLYTNGDGQLWCAFGSAEDAPIPRRWNTFGIFDDTRSAQSITVEINIPTDSNTAQVAGFFAADPLSGRCYLMHDGGVGGGKVGVGRTSFLAWSKASLVDVVKSDGSIRSGILIGDIGDPSLAGRVWRFVQLVRRFKDAVAAGELQKPGFLRQLAEFERYFKEFTGRKTGRRGSRIDYFSYHGDVVHQLYQERNERVLGNERVLKNPLIDLYVRNGPDLVEVYEVKTSLDRPSLYGAIGQLMTHALEGDTDVLKVLVVPRGDIPPDIIRCLAANSIIVRRFTLVGGRIKRVVLDIE